ncbi:hypothetical protein LX36DRAFT_195763 [Colletotrichum falcatum]|nr:hypothetical protein LX36DRAFT_195763 [Colletotrichum falcatum]
MVRERGRSERFPAKEREGGEKESRVPRFPSGTRTVPGRVWAGIGGRDGEEGSKRGKEKIGRSKTARAPQITRRGGES